MWHDKAPLMDLETDSQRQSDQIIEEPSKKEIEYPNTVVSVENEKKQIPVVNPCTSDSFSRHVQNRSKSHLADTSHPSGPSLFSA